MEHGKRKYFSRRRGLFCLEMYKNLDLTLPMLWVVPSSPGVHRAADRIVSVAASCKSHLPSRGGSSSWSPSSSASSEDTYFSLVLNRNALERGRCSSCCFSDSCWDQSTARRQFGFAGWSSIWWRYVVIFLAALYCSAKYHLKLYPVKIHPCCSFFS